LPQKGDKLSGRAVGRMLATLWENQKTSKTVFIHAFAFSTAADVFITHFHNMLMRVVRNPMNNNLPTLELPVFYAFLPFAGSMGNHKSELSPFKKMFYF
jgi:hypothetical protein